jgi:hypothetical protein
VFLDASRSYVIYRSWDDVSLQKCVIPQSSHPAFSKNQNHTFSPGATGRNNRQGFFLRYQRGLQLEANSLSLRQSSLYGRSAIF